MTVMQDWLYTRKNISEDKWALLTNSNTKLSYGDLDDYVLRWNILLSGWGLHANQRVGLLMNNDWKAVALLFALLRMGIVIVPLNARLSENEISYQLENSDCNIIIHDDFFLNKLTDLDQTHYRILSLSSIFQQQSGEYREYDINLESPFAIIHTSGTSGKPKGAVLTYGNVFYSAMASAYHIGHQPDDKWLCVLPLYHVGGLSILIRAVLYGITVDLRHKFDVNEVNHALSHEDVTLVSLVPTMLYRLLEARKEAWSPKLRLVLLGGAAASPELVVRCKAEGIPLATTYGMTEAASQIATTLPGEAVRKPGTVGKPLLFTQIRIVDENDKDVPTGEYGEIIVKGPTVMKEYYGNPEATAKTLRNGWLHTGDIGYLDADGDLFLVQRRSDLIVSGGENVYPAEVEAVLRQHPSIKEVAVVGVDDTEWGQKVVAAIVLHVGQPLTENDVEEFARIHLAGYKIPRVVKFMAELPQTSSGKIERVAVRDMFVT
jgi:o-succinylbenzoate---CoA ligase